MGLKSSRLLKTTGMEDFKMKQIACSHLLALKGMNTALNSESVNRILVQSGKRHSQSLQGSILEVPRRSLGMGSHGSATIMCKKSLVPAKHTFKSKSCEGDCPFMEAYVYEEINKQTNKFGHPNILKYFGFCINNPLSKSDDTEVCVLLEKADKGDLFEWRKNLSEKKLSKEESGPVLLDVMRQVISGLMFLHSCGICHLDISLENIFICGKYFKIGDFGCSRFWLPGKLYQGWFGKLNLMAPEVLNNQHFNPILADVYSLGVTFFMLLLGYKPWTGSSLGRIQSFGLALASEKIHPDLVSALQNTIKPEEERSSLMQLHQVVNKLTSPFTS